LALKQSSAVKRLTLVEKILSVALAVLLILAGVAWWETAPPALNPKKPKVSEVTATDLVDQNTYATAQRLMRTALTPEEQTYGQAALRIADHRYCLPRISSASTTSPPHWRKPKPIRKTRSRTS